MRLPRRWWCVITARAYPQLVSGPSQPEPEPVPIEALVSPLPRVKPQRLSMFAGRTPDVFHGQFVPDAVGLWTFRVDGWGDPIATWRKAVLAKLDAGQSRDRTVQRPADRREAAGARRDGGASAAVANRCWMRPPNCALRANRPSVPARR